MQRPLGQFQRRNAGKGVGRLNEGHKLKEESDHGEKTRKKYL